MAIDLPLTEVVTFVLVMTRLLAVFWTAPPFTGTMLPVQIRLALAASISMAVAPVQVTEVPTDTAGLVLAIVYQVAVGAMLGFVVQLLLSSLQIAGAMVDFSSGLSSAAVYDPFTQSSASPSSRLYQLLGIVTILVLDGHLMIVRGVLRSYEAAPLSGMRVDSIGNVLQEGVGQLMLAAVEISFPILASLLLAEVVLGLAARAAPKLNVMILGFAAKSMVMLTTFGLGLPLAVRATSTLLERGLRWGVTLAGGG